MKRIWDWFWDDENMWAVLALGLAVYGFASTIIRGRWMIGYSIHPILLLAILGTVFGVAQLLRKRWARWVGIAWLGTLVYMSLAIMLVSQFSVRSWFGFGLMAISTYFFFAHFFRRRSEESSDDTNKSFLSLVLLFRELPYLDRQVLAALAERAWGIEFDATASSEDEDDDNDNDASNIEPENDASMGAFIVGDPPLLVAKHPQALLLIHAFDRPYFDDPQEVADQITELRVRNAVLDHRAWVAVDVVSWFDEDEAESVATTKAYRLIARLLAELADDQVLAVIDTQAQQVFPYDPETERKLRSDDPCNELREPYYVPIIRIAEDDPAMLAAVAEARSRFSEFVAAFENRDGDEEQVFSVKAPFGEEDEVEFMWLQVTGIENDVVYGVLGNEPARGKLKLGDRVRTSVSQINDWVYLRNDEMIGGFTVKVLDDRSKQGPA